MGRNKDMRFCWIVGCVSLVALAADDTAPGLAPQIVSVVRADPGTGRLVRSIVRHPARHNTAKAWAETAASVDRYVRETSERYQVDPLLVRSVIQVESNYDPLAVSPKGAEGLMQLMPQTARRFAVRDSFSVADNIDGGVRYLKHLLTLFADREAPETLALAAYNAGEVAVMKHGGVPPYRETTQYVRKVAKKWDEARAAEAATRQPTQAAAEAYPPIEQFVDSLGVLHIQTPRSP
jgi:soluble lytic murein transglycosylase-like protein